MELCLYFRIGTLAAISAAALSAQPVSKPSSPGEYVVLTSGQRMRADYHNVAGNSVRLFQGDGYVDLPIALIRTYEPILRAPQPVARPADPAPAEPVSLDSGFAATTPSAPTFGSPEAASPEAPLSRFSSTDPRQMVREAAAQAGLPPEFVESVAKVESAFHPDAVSPKGAVGVMQLMPETAAKLGADPHNVEQNITAGTQLLRQLLLRYDGDVIKALAAYNAGEGAVDRYKGVPPYRETQYYVNKVIGAYLKAGGE